MAWTAPQTWTLGQVVQPSDMNTQVRDNLGETAAAKAATTGYLFRVTGANELEEVQDQTTGWLDASSAILPSGAFDSAAQRQLVESASERFWYELLFDDASTRYAQWQVALPHNADLRDATITIVWKAAATTGRVRWAISYQTVGNGSPWDASAVSFGADGQDTARGIAEVTNEYSRTATFEGSTGDALRIRIARVGDHADDTMSGDAKVLGVKLTLGLSH